MLTDVLRLQLPIWLVVPMLFIMFVLGVGGGYYQVERMTSPCPETADVCAKFANFWKAWDIASQHFVDPTAINPQKMTDGAITGMLDSLDDRGHTRYLSSEDAKAEREALAGHFEGIGAYIDVRDKQPLIIQPIEGSPAERAGIQPGDVILKVNGADMFGVTISELQSKVRGPRGTSVVLTIQHKGEEQSHDVTVMREEIKVPSVSWRLLPGKVAFVRLSQFSDPSADDMIQALKDAQAKGASAIILDLRNNPGGLVNKLVTIASQFLPPDTTVLLEQNRNGERKPYKTEKDGVARNIPLVVLVNNNTASAAEILAGALEEHGRAKVIGVPTFGTATVLQPYNLDGGAEMYLGISQWLTPNGKQVRDVGITPSEVVELPPQVVPLLPGAAAQLSEQELRASQDTQLVRALQVVDQIAKH